MTPIDRAIHADSLAGLDLNMLTAFRALLQERSVTRAAARLGLGQPATSALLRRLRGHFGDPLLVRDGTSYALSPLAGGLQGTVEQALAAAEAVLLNTASFRPETSDRTFTVMAADAALIHLGERLIPTLVDAPHVTLDFVALSDAAMRDLDTTLHAVDALVMTRGLFAGYPSADLWTDEWVLAVGERCPLTASDVTPERLSEMSWVNSFHGTPPVAAALEAWGIRPQVRVIVPSYVSLPLLLARSDRHVALIQRRLADRLTGLGGIRVLPGLSQAPTIQVALWWHAANEADAGHAWLRQRLLDATADLRP